jgi:hypothetical protein
MASGHEQMLAMMSAGKGKVDKSIRPPSGFGVVDFVFARFDDRFKDRWKELMGSQAGCEAMAREWQAGLLRFSDDAVRQAVSVYRDNYSAVPNLSTFTDVVRQVIKDRKKALQPEKRSEASMQLGKSYLAKIKADRNGGKAA